MILLVVHLWIKVQDICPRCLAEHLSIKTEKKKNLSFLWCRPYCGKDISRSLWCHTWHVFPAQRTDATVAPKSQKEQTRRHNCTVIQRQNDTLSFRKKIIYILPFDEPGRTENWKLHLPGSEGCSRGSRTRIDDWHSVIMLCIWATWIKIKT